jgi:hypothetical protein
MLRDFKIFLKLSGIHSQNLLSMLESRTCWKCKVKDNKTEERVIKQSDKMEEIGISFVAFFKVYEISISRTLIFKVNWLDTE